VINGKRIMVVLPAYNAGKTLERTIAEIPAGVVDDLLLVDDASGDDTVEVAKRLGITYVVHPENRGKGEAIKTGLRHWLARPGVEFILILDADGQHLPEEIGRFFAAAAGSDAGLFVGTRMNDVGESQQLLLEKVEGSLVGPSIRPVPFTNPDGSEGTDLYLAPEAFREAFAATSILRRPQ